MKLKKGLKEIKEKVRELDMEKLPETDSDSLGINLNHHQGSEEQLRKLVKKGFKPKMIEDGNIIFATKKIEIEYDYEIEKTLFLGDTEDPKEFFEELKELYEGGKDE